jgi:hypothetical protein
MTASSRQEEIWEQFYRCLRQLLDRVAREGVGPENDCWIDDDNMGTLQQKIYIWRLDLLRPSIIHALQRLLASFPGWEIRVAVGPADAKSVWPVMGLTIRRHEIIDGLRREYFPEPYRSYQYDGSRPGTEDD